MGNCFACLSERTVIPSSLRREANKQEQDMVMVLRTTDNEIFRFPGPVFVRDLLFGFHGFAVFHARPFFSMQQEGEQLPLHPETLLRFNILYHLRPWCMPSSVSDHPTLLAQESNISKAMEDNSSGCSNSCHHPVETLALRPASEEDPATEEVQSGFLLDSVDNHHAEEGDLATRAGGASPTVAAPTQKLMKEKVIKRVRFSEDLFPAARRREEAVRRIELLRKKGNSLRPPASLKEGELPRSVRKGSTEVVRLKIVVSKKQLADIMAGTLLTETSR
ncbi:hypothetical protein KP509_13G030400 [Ceratopteris richardii]|uniref:Uncharacterized protein n=1 Tax=Ceratopteris richardii TaxID=49495 RepID=A0A8T2TGH3_CERRI|nr:hypothetical protein KP509_13G030400 [Ceratopteris richardii]